MSLEFNEFYKKYGVRQASHLVTPPVYDVKLFDTPKRTIFHAIPQDEFQLAPDLTGLIYQGNTAPVYLLNITELSSLMGKPRVKPFNAPAAVRTVYIANKRFRRLIEVGSRDKQLMEIATVNYGFAGKGYTYMRSVYRDYFEWYNLNRTVCHTIAGLMDQTSRNHFIVLSLDKEVFPARTILDRGADEDVIGMRTATMINTHTKRWLLEFWKWLSETPSKSMLSEIPEEHLSRVNFVFTSGTDFSIVNLGRLRQWKKPTAADLQANPKLLTQGFTAQQYQKYFLFFLTKIQDKASQLVEDTAAPSGKRSSSKSLVDTTNAAIERIEPTNTIAQDPSKKSLVGGNNTGDSPVTDDQHVHEEHLKEYDKQIDDDLDAMEEATDEEGPEEDGGEVQDLSGDDEDEDSGQALLEAIDVSEPSTESDLSVMAVARKSDMSPEDAIIAACDASAAAGSITAPTYRAFKEQAKSYTRIKSPDGIGSLKDFMVIKPEALKVEPKQVMTDRPTILDKSMLYSTLANFDKQYIKEVHQKNVAMMIMGAQYGKVIVTGYEHERIEDVAGEYDTYAVKLQPIDGVPSTINIKMPVVREDGSFFANGVVYRMRKQQFDLPIRKVSPIRVALTSYMGKAFVDRSERKSANYTAWIGNQVMEIALTPDNNVIMGVAGGIGFDPAIPTPLVYSALGQRFLSFHYLNYIVYLKRSEAIKSFDPAALVQYEVKDSIVVGWDGADSYLVIDKNSVWYTAQKGTLTPLGTIENMLGIDGRKAPVPYATLKVFGQDIPVGFCMAYMLGIDKLMKMLKITPKRINVGQRYALEENEYSVVFADETLVFNRENVFATLVMAGFNEYHRFLRMYRYHDFTKKAVYANVLEANGLGVRYLRELILMDDMFVDPITKETLIRMGEPTTFRGLLGRAVQLLVVDEHPDEIDTAEMRFKGYERFSGAVYAELVKSMRVQRSRATRASKVVEMNPYAVWKTIMTDAAVMPIKEINPIEYLKDTASVTFSGTGGRSGRTMVKGTRRYHPNSMGSMSEATVDSGDVGVNVYLSNNPQIDTVMGTTTRYDAKTTGASSMLSVSAMLAPGADKDDPRRTGFINIQNSHTVACDGYTQMPFRTGAEQAVPYQVSDLYATMAEEDGVVTKLTEKSILVTYKSGKTRSVELGRRYGSAAGITIPHYLLTTLKEGQTVRFGQTIAFNQGYFEEDLLNPGFLVFKTAMLANIALFEIPLTHEDSSCISYRLSKRLNTKMTKIKNVIVSFDQEVTQVPKVNAPVMSSDILCVIGDASTVGKNYFSDNSLDTLKLLSRHTPTSGIDGVLERIEVYYHGEIEDMSPSLQALTKESDKQLTKLRKDMGKSAMTGTVDEGYRIEGSPLSLDTLVLKYYITTDVSAGVADKVVVSHQLKTVISKTIDDDIVTESGMPIDMFFGRTSLSARIVLSADIIGTSTLILQLIGKEAVKAYRK